MTSNGKIIGLFLQEDISPYHHNREVKNTSSISKKSSNLEEHKNSPEFFKIRRIERGGIRTGKRQILPRITGPDKLIYKITRASPGYRSSAPLQ
jgi:hypothetical protein